ncbi:Uncharacterised protein [Serratia fonticola]|uniref:Uncharacterized protein n=1 Tax=Serratia fonticola TaxID=47917 RepID=A0A4U9V3S5_SERFO|nr:Uncharacterised protein [Serratia fonticola]
MNPQHFYFEYIGDMVKLHPIKVNEQPDGYFSRLTFFHRKQFESQFYFNEQFNKYKEKYANYEASVIARILFKLIPDAPSESELYKKPKWVKKFNTIGNKNDSILCDFIRR